MFDKIVKVFVPIVSLVVAIVALLYFTNEIIRYKAWVSSGRLTTDFELNADSAFAFSDIDTLDFTSSPYPDSGDVIIAIDDSTATMAYFSKRACRPHVPGREIALTYIHQGDTTKTVTRTRPVDRKDIIQISIISLLRFFLVLAYLGVGLWALFKSPDSGAVRSLTLFCTAMAVFMISAVNIGFGDIETFTIPFIDQLGKSLNFIAAFFGAFWLNLQLLFPKPRKIIKNHPVAAYTMCYLPTPLIFLSTLFMTTQNSVLVGIGIITIQVWAGVFILARYHNRTTDLLEKRQTRLVLWGTGTGLLGFFIVMIMAIIANRWFVSLPENYIIGMISLLFLILLLSPLSFAYSFGKYRLLEVEGKIRRGTRYLAVTVVLLVVFFFMIYGISELVLTSIGIKSRAPTLFIALLLALGFSPAQRKVQALAERQIYPERNRLRMMLRDFLSQAGSYTDKNLFWTELESHLKDVLKVDAVYPILYFEKENKFSHWRKDFATPFLADSKFIESLGTLVSCPLMLDEALASKKIFLTDDEKQWLKQNNIAMILPLVTRSRLVGFIGLGYKAGQEDFNAEDCNTLMSLASQVAVAGENIMLLEENVEKRRLEAQLGIARKVQEGLLPEKLPDTPGLQVAGKSRSCLEVAGDYYDVVNIGNNHTVLAIGDVSGKGAGAALLMSNLQASFRTAVEIDTGLAQMMARVNNLIHRNTKPDQFITFFVGVYDNANSTFAYVNAGHNPPFVLHQSGQIEYLDKGGLILGALPGMTYEQGTIKLENGDLILLYTDGVSEAENAVDDMFGEDRLKAFLKANAQLPIDDILRNLETEVEQFTEGIPLTDDFTALVARVVKT